MLVATVRRALPHGERRADPAPRVTAWAGGGGRRSWSTRPATAPPARKPGRGRCADPWTRRGPSWLAMCSACARRGSSRCRPAHRRTRPAVVHHGLHHGRVDLHARQARQLFGIEAGRVAGHQAPHELLELLLGARSSSALQPPFSRVWGNGIYASSTFPRSPRLGPSPLTPRANDPAKVGPVTLFDENISVVPHPVAAGTARRSSVHGAGRGGAHPLRLHVPPVVVRHPAAGSGPQHLGTSPDADGNEVPLISVPDEQDSTSQGQLDLLTVQINGNRERTPSWIELAQAWFDPSRAVVPLDRIFPRASPPSSATTRTPR